MEVHTDVVAWGESLELEFEGMDLPTQSKEVDSDGQGAEIVVGDIPIALQAVNTSEENVKVSDREGMHLPGPSSGVVYFAERNNYNRILFGKRGTRENTIFIKWLFLDFGLNYFWRPKSKIGHD